MSRAVYKLVRFDSALGVVVEEFEGALLVEVDPGSVGLQEFCLRAGDGLRFNCVGRCQQVPELSAPVLRFVPA